jgi:hypothetical protein
MKQEKIDRIVRYGITRNGVKLIFRRILNDTFDFGIEGDMDTTFKVIDGMNLNTNLIPEYKLDYYAREIHHFINNM